MGASSERVASLIRDVFALALRVPHRKRQRELRRRGHDLFLQARDERREGRLEALAERAGRYLRETEARWGDRLGAKPRAVLEAEAAARAAQQGVPGAAREAAAAPIAGGGDRVAPQASAAGADNAQRPREAEQRSEPHAPAAGASPG